MSHPDEEYEELIQREIDGETTEGEKAALRDYVATNAKARDLQSGLTRLAEVLRRAEAVEPPSDLARSILTALPAGRGEAARVPLRGSWLSGFPILKYGYILAAGLILGFALHQFLFNDTSALPTTEVRGSMVPHNKLTLNPKGASGSIGLLRTEPFSSLEFDFYAQNAIRFELGFDATQVEFRGFNQQVNNVASFTATPGHIAVQCEGKQHFTILIANLKGIDCDLNIAVFVSEKMVQSGSIRLAK